MWSNNRNLTIIASTIVLLAVIGVATSHYIRPEPVLAQQSGPADQIYSSSTSANARVVLQLTVGSLPTAMAVGASSVELYLEDEFQVPDAIAASSVYFVATNPITRGTGSGARVYITSAPMVRNGSHFGGSNDWSIRVRIPDLCTDLTIECEGSNGPMRGQTLTLVIDDSSGIKNPSEAGNYRVGYSLLGPGDSGNRGPEVRLDPLPTYAKISLSDINNRRGYNLTVSGSGFNNGTTAAVYVLYDPSVGLDAFDDDISEAALCERIVDQGTLVGSSLVGSDDRVSVTFVVAVPIFGPGNTNYICMVDGEGRMSHTDVERFHLEHSIRVGPSAARIGDTTTVFAQDFPNIGAGFTELTLAGRTAVTADSSTSIGVDGSATATFTVPDGLVGTIGVEVTWGDVSASTRMTVVSATEALPLAPPANVTVESVDGTITVSWIPGTGAASQVIIAVNVIDDTDYCLDFDPSGSVSSSECTGRTAGQVYAVLVIALDGQGGYALGNVVTYRAG